MALIQCITSESWWISSKEALIRAYLSFLLSLVLNKRGEVCVLCLSWVFQKISLKVRTNALQDKRSSAFLFYCFGNLTICRLTKTESECCCCALIQLHTWERGKYLVKMGSHSLTVFNISICLVIQWCNLIKTVRSYATGVLFLLVGHYHLTRVSVCASQKYFFHLGSKWEMNVD